MSVQERTNRELLQVLSEGRAGHPAHPRNGVHYRMVDDDVQKRLNNGVQPGRAAATEARREKREEITKMAARDPQIE